MGRWTAAHSGGCQAREKLKKGSPHAPSLLQLPDCNSTERSLLCCSAALSSGRGSWQHLPNAMLSVQALSPIHFQVGCNQTTSEYRWQNVPSLLRHEAFSLTLCMISANSMHLQIQESAHTWGLRCEFHCMPSLQPHAAAYLGGMRANPGGASGHQSASAVAKGASRHRQGQQSRHGAQRQCRTWQCR